MKRILALFALALAASPLMAAPTNPGYICSGPHKYSVTLADPSDPNSAWSFPCLLPEYYSDQSLARYISQEKCLTELMLNWSENFLHFGNRGQGRLVSLIVKRRGILASALDDITF